MANSISGPGPSAPAATSTAQPVSLSEIAEAFQKNAAINAPKLFDRIAQTSERVADMLRTGDISALLR